MISGIHAPCHTHNPASDLLTHFRRITSRGRNFIPEIDGLRFVAIMAVVMFHLYGYTLSKHMSGATVRPYELPLVAILGTGSYGVHLFFVISGFLLTIPYARWRLGLGTRPSLRAYYVRRLTRLEPPYILSMLLMFAAGAVAFGLNTELSRWPNLLASLFYQHSLLYGSPSLVNGVAWTLEIEVQFYVLAPFLTGIFAIRSLRIRRALLAAAIVAIPCLRKIIWGSVAPSTVGGYFGILWYLELFLAGFLLADLFLIDWNSDPEHSFVWDAASLLAWPGLIALIVWGKFQLLIPFAILLACIGAFRGRMSSWIFRRQIITIVGGMCYSMYLLHYPVISLAGRMTNRLLPGSTFISRLAVDSLVILPAILAVTCAAFVLIERPCMDPAWPHAVLRYIAEWFEDVFTERRPRPSEQ